MAFIQVVSETEATGKLRELYSRGHDPEVEHGAQWLRLRPGEIQSRIGECE
jgi:hypothetical protein